MLEITGLTRHQYYYKKKSSKKRGRKKSSSTPKLEDGEITQRPNKEVVTIIKERQESIDLSSGYHRMTHALMAEGFFINSKKVYRLMKENQLLLPKPKRKSKNYAKYRTVTPDGPLQVFEMDIKMVWCTQHRRHAQVLTVLDVFTRSAIYWETSYNMKQDRVLRAWEQIIEHILQPHGMSPKVNIEIRNDNGPQFSAKRLREFFHQNGLDHVFTHPYTPQENGHVESFHAILSRTLDTYEFWSLEELEMRLKQFYDNYNNRRIHSSIANLPPNQFWQFWEEGKVQRIQVSTQKVKFKLLIPRQEISGKRSLREVPCFSFSDFDSREMEYEKVDRPITLKKQPSVQKSPSVAPC